MVNRERKRDGKTEKDGGRGREREREGGTQRDGDTERWGHRKKGGGGERDGDREREGGREREVTVVVSNSILTSCQSHMIFFKGSPQDKRAEGDIRVSEEEESRKLTKKSLTYDFFSNKKIISE